MWLLQCRLAYLQGQISFYFPMNSTLKLQYPSFFFFYSELAKLSYPLSVKFMCQHLSVMWKSLQSTHNHKKPIKPARALKKAHGGSSLISSTFTLLPYLTAFLSCCCCYDYPAATWHALQKTICAAKCPKYRRNKHTSSDCLNGLDSHYS